MEQMKYSVVIKDIMIFMKRLNLKKNSLEILMAKNYLTLERMKIFDRSEVNFLNSRVDIIDEFKSVKGVINKILVNDQMSFLKGYLSRADQIGMMYGQEIRTLFVMKE